MVDVAPFKPFQAHRPITSAYVSMQQGSIPLPYQFLSAQVDDALRDQQKTAVFASQALFDTFIQWLRNGNHDMKPWNSCVFGKVMTSLETRIDEINSKSQKIFWKHRTEKCHEYRMDFAGLRAFLKKTALYYKQ
jgi:hypothetical protein